MILLVLKSLLLKIKWLFPIILNPTQFFPVPFSVILVLVQRSMLFSFTILMRCDGRTSEVFPQHCSLTFHIPADRSLNQRSRTFVNARIQHADSDHRKCSDGQNRLEVAKTQPLRSLMHPGAFWSRPAGRSRRSTKSTRIKSNRKALETIIMILPRKFKWIWKITVNH